jgi:hypothetical protein
LRKYVFPFGSCLLSWPPPSRLSVQWALAVSFVFSPAPPDPGRVTADFHRAAAHRTARSAPQMPPSHYRPPSLPPLQIVPYPAVMSRITQPLKPPLAVPYLAFTAPAFYCLIACVCFAVGNVAPEPFFDDFQDEAFEESQLFFVDQQGTSP